MRDLILIVLFMTPIFIARAQTLGDSLLANERSIDRPLNVHKKQLRIGGAYGLAVNSKRFDSDGNSIDLSQEGLTNISHNIFLEINYGLFEFLQTSILINHIQQGQRSRNIVIIAPPEDPLNINEITEQIGWSDLNFTLDFKVPFQTKQYDFVISAGRSLPISAHEPDQPAHEIESGQGFENLTYRFINNAGKGVASWLLGGKGKIRSEKMAFSIFYNVRSFVDEGQSLLWMSQLNSGSISYSNRTYNYQLGDEINYHLLFEYQAISFFNVFLGYSSERVRDGWTEITGQRVLVPEQRFSLALIGAEAIITPRLWLRQELGLPISGMNRLTPFTLSTRISYNLFPF